MSPNPKTVRRVIKPAWFLLLMLPAIWLFAQWGLALTGGEHALTVNPFEFTNRYLGDWALRILIATLSMTPLSRMTGSNLPIQLRRMTGLFAFSYVLLHVSSYVGVDQFFDWPVIWSDIVKRKYITIGMTCLILLTPLAVTSTKKMVKRLGGRRWRNLHRLIYVIGPLAGLHFEFMAKGNQLEPKIYIAIILFLLALRIPAVAQLIDRRARARSRAQKIAGPESPAR